MARKKVAAEPVLKSWAQVDEALNEIDRARLVLSCDQGELDRMINDARARYTARMDPAAAKLKRLEKDVQEYVTAHKGELETEEKKRSRDLPNGTVGFRRSTELATKPGLTWKGVLDILVEAGRRAKKYIRTKAEVNKEAVHAAKLDEAQLGVLGMRMQDKDTFYYELAADRTAETIPVDESVRKAG